MFTRQKPVEIRSDLDGRIFNSNGERWFNQQPGDSIRDLFIPKRWRSLNPLKGPRNHPKKVTSRIARN